MMGKWWVILEFTQDLVGFMRNSSLFDENWDVSGNQNGAWAAKNWWFDHQIVLNQWLMSMDWFKGKFTGNHRFSMIFPLNMGLSCKFSLNPIHWYYWIQPSNVAVLMTQDWLGSLMVAGLRQSYESYRVTPGLSIYLSCCLPIHLFVCLPACLAACLLPVCMSVRSLDQIF